MSEVTIITFANQKGGVGKTTLCTLFANYLVAKGKRTIVIDCDGQQTIFEKRKADYKKYKEQKEPYKVQAFSIAENFVGDICLCGFQLHCNGYNSEETKAKQEQAAAAEVERFFRKAKEILAKHRPLLDGIARGLMKKGFLTAVDIAEIRRDCEKAA